MNRFEARQTLLLYRPGTPEAREPEIAEALERVGQDPELARWFEQHCAFQAAVREKLRQIEVPADLKARITAQRRIVRLPVWRRNPVWLAAAAAMVLLAGLAVLWTRPRIPDHFEDFQVRMVRAALREYAMDVKTNDMQQVRQFLDARGAPADYQVSAGLEQLELAGGGFLRWRSNPVSMVCFGRDGNPTHYLFVIASSALKDPPPPTPRISTENKLEVAAWSREGRSYLLAGPKEPDFRKYL